MKTLKFEYTKEQIHELIFHDLMCRVDSLDRDGFYVKTKSTTDITFVAESNLIATATVTQVELTEESQ